MTDAAIRSGVLRAGSLLALVVVVSPGVAGAEPTWCLGGFGQLSPMIAVFDMPADGHGPSEKSALDVGVGGDVLLCRRWFELGVGVRYDFANGGRDNAHFVTAPVRIGARIPVGAKAVVRIAAGAGPGVGFVAGYADGNATLVTFGPSFEILLGFLYRSGSTTDISIELGGRFDVLAEVNADTSGYLDDTELLHAQLPFVRIGASWR